MSIKIMSKVWELDLKSTDKFVLIALADHANDDGECYPSYTTIMAKTGLSEQGLRNVINRLIKLEFLSRETRFRDNKSTTSNLYKIHAYTTPHNIGGEGQHGGGESPKDIGGDPQHGGGVLEPSLNRQLEPSVKPSPKLPQINDEAKPYETIIEHLNEQTGSSYRANTPKTKQLIDARMKEGFTVEDFKTVIDKKTAMWKNDTKMVGFLRPETLFGTKFEGYLNEHISTARAMAANGAISETTAHNIEVAQRWEPKHA